MLNTEYMEELEGVSEYSGKQLSFEQLLSEKIELEERERERGERDKIGKRQNKMGTGEI